MKKYLLAGVALIAVAGSPEVQAQLIPAPNGVLVFDATNAVNFLKSIGIEGEQLTQAIATLQEIIQVYEQATHIYQSVAEVVGVGEWATGLVTDIARNPLPFHAADHPNWVGGFNSPAGLPFGNQYLTANTIGGDISVYRDGRFVGGELIKAINSSSTMQALATNNIMAIENRINALGDLFAKLASIGSIQQSDSLIARLHTEANYAHAQQNQSQNLYAAAAQQLQVLEYNQKQWEYQDEVHGISGVCSSLAASPNPVHVPECP
jgi:Type IV secretion system proteins